MLVPTEVGRYDNEHQSFLMESQKCRPHWTPDKNKVGDSPRTISCGLSIQYRSSFASASEDPDRLLVNDVKGIHLGKYFCNTKQWSVVQHTMATK
mmetsp:Transcript_483/g.1166  ORF Transcript_483/g.1166 Transcript_483/m.1166 type:complete len:95 (+) Transcript_483:1311-1595(+)